MVALVGDAELDEGNVYECLQEGWKHGLRNTWWIIDYNRQSLDGVVHEGLWSRVEAIFTAFGWRVEVLRFGAYTMSSRALDVVSANLHEFIIARQFGFKGFFGDPTRPELLHAAGLHKARVLVDRPTSETTAQR